MAKSDIQTLLAWSHWKRLEKDVDEDELEFAKAIADVCSQVNGYKARLTAAQARILKLEAVAEIAKSQVTMWYRDPPGNAGGDFVAMMWRMKKAVEELGDE